MNSKKEIKILLVEDNPGDVRLTKEALRTSLAPYHCHTVSDGVEALEFLTKESGSPGHFRPDLILLDLNLPRMDGRELLGRIKSHDKLKSIPVIVLTTSDDKSDIAQTYELHANCYILKPIDFGEFMRVFEAIDKFWFNCVALPPQRF